MAETLMKDLVKKAASSGLISENAIMVESAGLFVVEESDNNKDVSVIEE